MCIANQTAEEAAELIMQESTTFGVTVARLREAVAKVVNGSEKVRQTLGK